MSGFPYPNTFGVPDEFYNILPEMEEYELKVILVMYRHTYSVEKVRPILSLSYFQSITGLSIDQVVEGVAIAEERGLICLSDSNDGDSVYELVEGQPQ